MSNIQFDCYYPNSRLLLLFVFLLNKAVGIEKGMDK